MRSLAREASSSRPRAAESRVEPVHTQRLLQRFGFHDLGVVGRSGVERIDAGLLAFDVAVYDQFDAMFARRSVAEGDHLAELPAGVDVEQRERDGAG